MKAIATLVLALSLLGSTAAIAKPGDQPRADQRDQPAGPNQDLPRWARGDRIDDQHRDNQYVVTDWRNRNLSPPPRGYNWMCYERGDCVLVRIQTGIVRETRWRDERQNKWRERYARTYTYNDDLYYRECRNRPDPAGILLGGLIGGLIGHAINDERSGATFAGVIIGGALGAAMTRDLDCSDRNYAYRAYYDALNSGHRGAAYQWYNPSNNHRGEFRVRSYYYDTSRFYCAKYSHTLLFDKRRQSNGRACRQPDGAWAFLD
jgi:Ni/Co efflux regulator RcnB/surface antigen